MDTNVAIADMFLGQELEGFYVINDPVVKTASTGKSFLSAKISDASGSMELKVWDYAGSIAAGDSGKVVKVRGEVKDFKGSLQFDARRFRFADPAQDSYDVSALVPTAPIDADETFDAVKKLVDSIEDEDYKKICLEMLARHGKSFTTIPAAKSFHHKFLHGLLMHTCSMMELADFLAFRYSEIVDRSLLIAGTFLHDFAKDREFSFSELGLVKDYSTEGKLLGHLVMGAQEVAEIAKELAVPKEKAVLLQHMLLSHHGQPEYGACVLPQCAEAELLSYIDLIDSRMEIYAETFENVPKGEFSSMIFALNKKLYNHN